MEHSTAQEAARVEPETRHLSPPVYDIQFSEPEGHLGWGINE
jgi:hypothetical protein